MEANKFKELLKDKTPHEIITLYHKNKIDLTDCQLEKLIKLKNKGE